MNFETIALCTICVLVGYSIGVHSKSKRITLKTKALINLANEVKSKNNQMVNNMANIYAMTKVDHSKFTEIDEQLMAMWMD